MGKRLFIKYGIILVSIVNHALFTVSAEETSTSTFVAGTLQSGWVTTEDGHKQWLDEIGIPIIGWQNIGGKTYYFDNNGYMQIGKQLVANKYYLFDIDGTLITSSGLIEYEGYTYYILSDNSLKRSDWETIDGKDYYFDDNGNILSGKQNIAGINYFFTEDDSKHLFKGGLIQARNGEWYYSESNGQLATSTTKIINGSSYYFDENSILQNNPLQTKNTTAGWQSINGSWYYFNQDGSSYSGWLSYAGKKYYLYSDGRMATGWIATEGHYQYLDNTGIQQFGWQFINGNWYALGNDGNMITGWLAYGDKKYYFHPDGRMATGLVWLDNKYQFFYANGLYAGDSHYRLLGVANYNQYSEGYPDGCEGISLFQALQYKGYLGGMSLHNFMYTIPTSTNPFYGYAASGGYAAIFPTPLANWGKGYSGGMTFDISGSSFDSLLEEVKNGNPVIAYVTTYYTPPTWRNYPFGPNLYNNHAVTLDGYDRINNLVHVSDPVSGAKWMDMFTVASVYDARKYAVVVK